ncbi:MAG: hypothetical protein IKS41_05825 [Alphaproteobacteria bacterium]|nr:hypothetical protein [Alphaproteobacteria bacterium]
MIYRYTTKEICEKTVKNWGRDSQLLMVLEEMSELQKEILKNLNRDKDNVKEIAEETADVLIMLERLIYIYKIEDLVAQQAEFKVNRLKQYL